MSTTARTMLEERRAQEVQRNQIRLETIAREHRDPTPDEESAIAQSFALQDRFEAESGRLDADEDMMDEITRLTTPRSNGEPAGRVAVSRTSRNGRHLSLGQQVLASDIGKYLKDTKTTRSGAWRSPSVELLSAVLTEDPASGGSLVQPEWRPGIVPLQTRPLTMAALFAQGQADSNAIGFMREKTFTNNADTVLEGGVKPESALTFEQAVVPLRKIAHWLPTTDEILDDVPQLQSYIDARLRLGIEIVLDDQLLNGTGVAPDLLGILATPGLAPSVVRTDPDSNADALLKQISAIQVATGLRPDGIVMNPVNWQTSQLMKATDGTYIGASPFSPVQTPTLWGLPVALTGAIVAGTALVGSFRGAAQLFRKGGIRVEISNSHADYWIKNLLAIRAEVRAALVTYRPAAFGTISSLT